RGAAGGRAAPKPVIKRDQIQHVQVLALVLVQPLHLNVEQGLRIHDDARSLLNDTRQLALVVGLYGLPVPPEIAVGRQWLQPLELVFQIRYPSLADVPSDECAQFRVAQSEPAPRRHAVRDVEKLLRRYPVEVAEHRLLQELGMESGDTVDRVAAHAGEMGHAYVSASRFINQRKPSNELIVVRIALPDVIEKAAIDLVDDLQMAWQ